MPLSRLAKNERYSIPLPGHKVVHFGVADHIIPLEKHYQLGKKKKKPPTQSSNHWFWKLRRRTVHLFLFLS